MRTVVDKITDHTKPHNIVMWIPVNNLLHICTLKLIMLVHCAVPACFEVSDSFSDSMMSLVNFSKDFTSFSITLSVPSSSDELTL